MPTTVPPPAPRSRTATRRVWALVALAGLIAVAAVIIASMSMMRGMMTPRSETPAQLVGSSSAVADVVLEVAGVRPDQSLVGTLLTAQADTSYLRTPTQVRVKRTNKTQIVMGSASDLRVEAVIAVRGARSSVAPLTIDATRIVIITDYATVH